MKLKDHIKKILYSASAYFTIIIILYTLAVIFVNVDAGEILLEASRVMLFLFFSLLLSVANYIFALKILPTFARVLIHFVLTAFAFYLCFMAPISPTPSTAFVGITLYTILYFVLSGIIAVIKSRYKRQSESEEKYEKRFSK